MFVLFFLSFPFLVSLFLSLTRRDAMRWEWLTDVLCDNSDFKYVRSNEGKIEMLRNPLILG